MLAVDGEAQLAPKPQQTLQDKEAVIKAAAKGLPVDGWLTDQEFSDRYRYRQESFALFLVRWLYGLSSNPLFFSHLTK